MSNSGQAQEPTMEEILASIRRIISEDSAGEEDAQPEAAPEAPPPASEPEESFALEEDSEVLELTEALPEEPAVAEPEPSFVEEPAPAPEPEPVAYSAPSVADIEEEVAASEAADEVEFEPEIEAEIEDDFQVADIVEEDLAAGDVFPEDDDIVFEELSEEPVMSAETAEPLLSEAANSNLMSRVTEDAAAAAFGALSSSLVTSTGEARTDRKSVV